MLRVTEFIRSNGEHIEKVQAYLQQCNMEQSSVLATENEILMAARLMYRDIVVFSFYETCCRSVIEWLYYPSSRN